MTPARARCDFTGCTKYARPGETRCTTHLKAIDRKGEQPSALEQGMNGYGKFQHLVGQAAADGAAEGLDNEIDVLRLVMQRLLAEEADPSKLATGVAKISNSIINAMRVRRTLSGEAADDFTNAVALILDEIAPP